MEVIQAKMRIAVIGALKSEIIHLLNKFPDLVRSESRGLALYEGKAGGHDLIFAVSGMGQLKCASAAAALIERSRPDQAVLTGTCGALAPGVSIGDAVIARDIVYYDISETFMDSLSERLKKGFSNFRAPESVLPFHQDSLYNGKVHRGLVLSGNNPVAGAAVKKALYEKWGGLCAEMEGAGFAAACEKAGVPWSVVRVVTDECGELEQIMSDSEPPELLKKLSDFISASLGLG